MRKEEDKLFQAPIKAKLGEKEYEIAILPIKRSRLWREEFYKAVGKIPDFTVEGGVQSFKDIAGAIFVAIPDTVIDLVFSYAPDLNRDEIEEVATDQQLADVFGAIAEAAFPLATSLVKTMGQLSR